MWERIFGNVNICQGKQHMKLCYKKSSNNFLLYFNKVTYSENLESIAYTISTTTSPHMISMANIKHPH